MLLNVCHLQVLQYYFTLEFSIQYYHHGFMLRLMLLTGSNCVVLFWFFLLNAQKCKLYYEFNVSL